MGLLDRVKAGAEQAASQAQRQAQIVQTKRELSQGYNDLGKTVYGLVSAVRFRTAISPPGSSASRSSRRASPVQAPTPATPATPAPWAAAGTAEADIVE